MEFKYYNPEKLIPIFRDRGFIPYFYRLCVGCIVTEIPAEDCIHHADEFRTSSVQPEMLCSHCYDTAEESGKSLPLGKDKFLHEKLAELEEIIEMTR